jgi:hypothetical protein
MTSANTPMTYQDAMDMLQHINGTYNVCMNRAVAAIEAHVTELETYGCVVPPEFRTKCLRFHRLNETGKTRVR